MSNWWATKTLRTNKSPLFKLQTKSRLLPPKKSCPELKQGRVYKAPNYNDIIPEVSGGMEMEGGCSNSIDHSNQWTSRAAGVCCMGAFCSTGCGQETRETITKDYEYFGKFNLIGSGQCISMTEGWRKPCQSRESTGTQETYPYFTAEFAAVHRSLWIHARSEGASVASLPKAKVLLNWQH